MRVFDQIILPLGALLAAAFGAFIADRTAGVRRPDGDRGDFWARVVRRVCLFLALPALLSGALATVPQIWQTGWHLQFDLTGVFGWSLPFCYRMAVLLPFVVWGLLLVYGLAEAPGGREAGRWLAGAIGFGNSRLWVLVWVLPLAVLLATARADLGGGPGAYPGAVWGMLAVLALSLIGVALSAGRAPVSPAVRPGAAPAAGPQLRPWPQALEAHGVRSRSVASWPASPPARQLQRSAAADLAERLRLRGARHVAPELIEAVDGLLGPAASERGERGERGPNHLVNRLSSRLVFAQDGCGQAEVVALAAELLDQRFHAATLVVTASGAAAVAAEIGRWLPAGWVTADEPADDALVRVIDAQTLSDRFLPQLGDPLLVKRFGLIVWWHLEAYTGVVAANLWAISRRLHRLLQTLGRPDVRTLALVRSTPHGGAQLAAFVRRLLPHPFPAGAEVHVEPRFPRAVHLHRLESHQGFFARGEGRNIQERVRHLPLVAAKVSVEEEWPTCLELPDDVADSEAEAFLQLPAGAATLRERLQGDSAAAGARLRKIQAGEVLALPEIVAQGGRAAADGLPHHVGVTLPPNPYVAYLLSTLAGREGGPGFRTSRRLVSAEAQPSVVRRHLLLALNELPDTRSGLLKNFLWNEEVIRRTLAEIAHEGKLQRREVRFLGDGDRLVIDHEYRSQRLPAGERRPLDTVGATLLDVRDPAGGHEPDEGVRMRVDPERLTIQAYPHCVFLDGGRRYRIREWGSLDSVLRQGWLACDREDVYSLTWRMRNAYVFGLETTDAPVGVGRRGKLLGRLTVSLRYEEEVVGALRLTPDLTSGELPKPETLRLARPISQSFATRALVLRFPEEEEPVALASLAQALRHVLPVHLGVEDDALEVVPLTGETVQGRPAFGLAIVDLYPGGIGLIDAVGDDNSFLLELFEWSRDWLAACPCQSDPGCPLCLRSPSALAANSDRPPLRSAALGLLRQVV